MGYKPAYNYSYDPVKAEENFKKAWEGQIWEEGFTIPVIYIAGEEAARISCELLKEGVESINPKFKVLIMPMDLAVFDSWYYNRKITMACYGDWINYPDPHIAYEQQLASYSLFQLFGAYSNEEVDRLISAAFVETDDKLREEMYFEIADKLATEAIAIYRDYWSEFTVTRDWLKGYFFNPWYAGFYWFWLSK